jgi:hypothetical protein
VQATLVDPDQLSRLDVADRHGADDVEPARLRCHAEARGQLADAERPDAVRVPRRVHAALVHHHEAEGALELRQHVERRGLEAAGVHARREHRRDQIGVGGRGAGSTDPCMQVTRVDEVPVVAEGDRVDAVGLEDGLRVLPRGRARRRVPRVADAEIAVQRGERRLREDLGDEPEVLVDEDVLAVADRDARRFLAAVLLCEEPEVREPRDVLARGPDPEQPALVLR